MKKGSDKQSRKDWEDEFEEMESIYKFPYPENFGDVKANPSDSLSIILTTPITMHKNIARSRKTYSRAATRPMIGLGEAEKLVIDTQLKKKNLESKSSTNNKKSKNIQKLPEKEEPVDQSNLNVGSETHDLFATNTPEVKNGNLKSGKISAKGQSNTTGYHRTRKILKRKLEEEKKVNTLPIQNTTNSTDNPTEVVNMEENSEESSSDLNLIFQPPPPAQKFSLMDLVQKYSQKIDPSQLSPQPKKSRKPVTKAKQEKKTHPVSRKVVSQKSKNCKESNKKIPEAAKSSLLSEPFQEKSQAIVGNNGVPNSISSDEKIISHMNMCDSLIKACKSKISNSKCLAMLSSDEKSVNLNSINTECDYSLNRETTQSNATISNSSCVSSNTVVERMVSVQSIISRENTCETVMEPDFQILHRSSYLQSADFFCAFMSEIDAKKNGSVDETDVTSYISVRQFCSSPNVNDAFSEILSGYTVAGDRSSPNICYKFPDNFLEEPFQMVLIDYVDWILDKMISCKNNLNNCYFPSKYILDFSYKHMSYQECAIMSKVFSDPKEHLLLSSIAAKLSFVGMVIIFNAYVKETCNSH